MTVHDFSARWLAECLRIEGVAAEWQRSGAARIPDTTAGDEAALLDWAAAQPEAAAVRIQLHGWRRRAGWALLLMLLIVALAALVGAWGVLGDGLRPVNTLWTLVLLLGLPTLSLLGAVLLGFRRGGGGVSLGATAWQGMAWLGRLGSARIAAEALARLLTRGGVLPRLFATLSHLLWTAAMGGALLGLLLAFSLRSYQFVWQTTVLPESVFVAVVQTLGVLPGWVGFAQPSAEAIAASSGGGLDDPAVRRAWASWLIGVLCVFGLLPRLLLLGLESSRWTRGLTQIRLPIHEAFYQQLLRQRAQLRSVMLPADSAAVLPRMRFQQYAGRGKGVWLVGLELPALRALPVLDEQVHNLRVDERDERRQLLDRLRAQPAERLLFAVEARQSPDRSLGGLMSETSQYSARTAVWLLDVETAPAERAAIWREFLESAELPRALQFATRDQALAWLIGAGP